MNANDIAIMACIAILLACAVLGIGEWLLVRAAKRWAHVSAEEVNDCKPGAFKTKDSRLH